MVAREGVQEAQEIAPSGRVDYLIDAGERVRALGATLVEVREVHAQTFLVGLRHNEGVGNPVVMVISCGFRGVCHSLHRDQTTGALLFQKLG